ncbi:MAG: hypothetical protein ACP5R5_06980 [Armatimonadota bacterium]
MSGRLHYLLGLLFLSIRDRMHEAQILSRLTANNRFTMLGKGPRTYTFVRAEGR